MKSSRAVLSLIALVMLWLAAGSAGAQKATSMTPDQANTAPWKNAWTNLLSAERRQGVWVEVRGGRLRKRGGGVQWETALAGCAQHVSVSDFWGELKKRG